MSERKSPIRWWPEVLVVIGALALSAMLPELTAYWIAVGFKSGYISWASDYAHSIARLLRAAYYHLPQAVLSVAVGVLLGLVARRSALRLAWIFAVIVTMCSLLLELLVAGLSASELLVLLGGAPLTPLGAWILYRNRKEIAGRCRSCGYNLRGLSEPRCPECGTPFDQNLVAGGGA